jgi:hypothetical protein
MVAVRPKLFISLNPAGSIKVQLRDVNGKVISESPSSTIADLKTAASAGNYFHGYVKFDLEVPLQANVEYQFAVVCFGGYSFSPPDFVGVCLEFENKKYEPDYTPNTGLNSHADFEIWERVNL